jgi:hypothetical protein
MNKIIIGILVLVLIMVYYFFAPIKWTFGLRSPKNYKECIAVGGKQLQYQSTGAPYCIHKGLEYDPNELSNNF